MSFQCEICQHSDYSVVSNIDAKTHLELPVVMCNACSLVQQERIPTDDELRTYYTEHYRQDYKNTYSPRLKHVKRAGVVARQRLAFLKTVLNDPSQQSLLDIGAGGGEFIYIAQKEGIKASGIDPNIGYSEYAKKHYGVDIQIRMLDELKQTKVNVVTLFHVLEHMAHPQEVMKKVAELLEDDGLLFVEVPNVLQKDASPHNIFYKAHLFYYSRFTLASAASQYFDLVKVDDTGNLKAIFRKRPQPLATVTLPQNQDILFSKKRLAQKGWFEYLFSGGGILKIFSRIRRMVSEHLIDKSMSPKELLDRLNCFIPYAIFDDEALFSMFCSTLGAMA